MAIATIVFAPRASAADAGADAADDSGIRDSGVSTVPSEGGRLVDANASSSSSGDPAPAVAEDDGGCALSRRPGPGGDGWASIGVLATAAFGVILRARRRNK